MKKAIAVIILCLSLSVASFAMSFAIKVTGGPNFLFGGDYNKIAEDANHPMYGPIPLSVSGEIKKLSLAWNFGAEFIMNFTDRLGLGLGVGYLTASNDSSLTASLMIISESYNYKPSFSVVPITLSFHYSLPLSRSFRAHFSAGPGLYLSQFKFQNHYIMSMLLTDVTETFDSNTRLFVGAQGSLGLEYALSPRVWITLDVVGRLAQMDNLSGTHTFSGMLLGITGNVSFDNHTFYYFETNGGAQYAIQDHLPSGADVTNAHTASFSLSGVGAVVGVKINI